MLIAPCEMICDMSERQTITAPFSGVVVAIPFAGQTAVGPGTPVVVLEAMKMEHEVLSESAGVVHEIAVEVGDAVEEGQILITLEPADGRTHQAAPEEAERQGGERADLRAVRERHE